ncbi:MAG TPA: hypothetical protein VKM55_19805 [Candidatus Lokiarchaeia archaeon]|nr:hypothetical protein [Candidatus Lokiarchaeia archaeon]
MDFIATPAIKHVNVPVSVYFDGHCLSCESTDTRIRSSYTREVADLGSPIEQRIADVTMATIECNNCGCTFTPVSREYPLKYEYSLAVITYALARYYHDNASANDIARELATLHGVEVPADTIYTWIKRLSDDYVKAMTDPSPASTTTEEQDSGASNPDATLSGDTSDGAASNALHDIKTITIDGTFVTTGVDVVGKKKPAGCLSIAKKKDGTLRLTSYK